MGQDTLDRVRKEALDRIDKSQKSAIRLLVAGAIFETVLLITVLALMDLGDRLHLIVFFAACLVYAPLAFGMFALKSHIDASTLRVLQALEAGNSI